MSDRVDEPEVERRAALRVVPPIHPASVRADPRTRWLECLLGAGIALAALTVQWLLWPYIQPSPFLLMTIAVLLGGWRMGWAPGLTALAITAVGIDILFLAPDGSMSFDPRDLLTIGFFIVVGVLTTGLNVARLHALRSAHDRQRWFQTTLSSIGDAVIAADPRGRIQFLNEAAEDLTGWSAAEAIGRPLSEVFQIINEQTRAPVESPVDRVIREGRVVGLANHTALISRTGREYIIEDSGAPIKDNRGELLGVVGGLGLGLFIARQFAEAHGGTIVAQSQPGAGSTFTVALPLTAREPAVPQDPVR